jgi:hypothetical protein
VPGIYSAELYRMMLKWFYVMSSDMLANNFVSLGIWISACSFKSLTRDTNKSLFTNAVERGPGEVGERGDN